MSQEQEGEPRKPLHVLVAEALGWGNLRDIGGESEVYWTGTVYSSGRHVMHGVAVPRYDLDWGLTGPLIVGCGISLVRESTGHWRAWDRSVERVGRTPLGAACLVIVARNNPHGAGYGG